MKGLVIGIVFVVIAAFGVSVYFLFPYSSQNVIEETSNIIEDKSTEISKSISNPVTSAVNSVSSYLSPFEINTSCELAYWIQNTNGMTDFGENNLEHTNLSQKWMKDAQIEVGSELIGISEVEYRYAIENPESPEAKKLGEEMMLYYQSENIEESANMVTEKIAEKYTNWIMEKFSINPSLREDVKLTVSAFTLDQIEKLKLFRIVNLIELEKYAQDLECGKKYHEDFGDETFKQMKILYGEEWAQERQREIKQTLYG